MRGRAASRGGRGWAWRRAVGAHHGSQKACHIILLGGYAYWWKRKGRLNSYSRGVTSCLGAWRKTVGLLWLLLLLLVGAGGRHTNRQLLLK